MKKNPQKICLLKTDIICTFFIVTAYILIFILSGGDKALYNGLGIYASIFIGFLYYFYILSMSGTRLNNLKNEAKLINYPLYIAIFFIFLALLFLSSFIALSVVNKDALNITFISAFFINLIFSVFPAILLILFMYFIMPAFIIPGIKIKNTGSRNKLNISKILFLLFLITGVINAFLFSYKKMRIDTLEKYEVSKIMMHFSAKYLKFSRSISPYSKKKMESGKIQIPFLYTKEAVPFDTYEDARRFCSALNARTADYKETYYILFNKFDTFGNKYYWTSNNDQEHNIVIHFNNMSYTAERLPENVKPMVYCVSDIENKFGKTKTKYFYRNVKQERIEKIKSMVEKPFNISNFNNIIGAETQNNTETDNLFASEKKYVNFSIKEVPPDVFERLADAGYNYNPSVSVKQEFETNDNDMQNRLGRNADGKEVRLCYYPFVDYDGFNMYNEAQIYKQSFCSPSFELLNRSPALKTRSEKDAYCYSRGGRLPNIPELYGIIKTYGTVSPGIKYWTNNKLADTSSDTMLNILVYNEDSRFVKLKPVASGENESAYTYCIKNSQNPSKVIANYMSRFQNIDGKTLAKQQCPDCIYYEMPDVVLKK